MSWREVTLGELCSEGGGGVQTGPFGSQLHAADYVMDGIPSVMPQNIGDNIINEVGIARITENDARRLEKYTLRAGDIVYSRRGDVEKRALVRAQNDGWLCGTGCLRVRVGDPERADARFVSYLLGEPETRAWISRHAVGATMPNLNTTILSNVPLRLPKISDQKAIAAVLGAFDAKLAVNNGIIRTTMSLMRARYDQTLQDAPSGSAVVESMVRRLVQPRKISKLDVSTEGTVPVFDQSDEGLLGYASGDGCLRASPSQPVLYFGDHTCKLRIATQDFFAGPNTIPFVGDGIEAMILFFSLEGAQMHEEYKRHWQGLMKKRVVLPNPKHHNELVDIFVGFLTLRMSLQAENRQLVVMRDTLLPELMSGRLRVKDAEKKIEEVV